MSISRRMGLIERIGGKAFHFVKYFIGNFFGYAVFSCSLNKDTAFLQHFGCLFLCHCSADKIRSAVGISRHFAAYLHYLLLVNYAAVGNVQNAF